MRVDLKAVRGFRDIGKLMLQPSVDSNTRLVTPSVGSISLKRLRGRHRFRPGEPSSLKEIARRWRATESSKTLGVLSYNTFLMDLKINVFETLDELLPGDGAFEVVVGAAIGAVTGGLGGILGGTLAGMGSHAAREALESVKGALVSVPATKPNVKERAFELGIKLVQEKVDVAVLCEVWAVRERAHVMEAIAHAGAAIQGMAQGAVPNEDDNTAGSGLMTVGLGVAVDQTSNFGAALVTQQQLVERSLYFRYSKQGAADQDSDHYADKGVLLTRIATGLGDLDLYSTHLYYGDELPDIFPLSKPTVDQRRHWRKRQLDELALFVRATHRPENVAIVVGDFNIDANEDPHRLDLVGHAQLTEVMESLGFADEWAKQFALSPIKPIDGTENASPSQEHGAGGGRIDYVFVEEPRAEHAFNVDVTRIQPNDFPRADAVVKKCEAAHPDDPHGKCIKTLSDHRALLYTLLCSSKH